MSGVDLLYRVFTGIQDMERDRAARAEFQRRKDAIVREAVAQWWRSR